MNKVIVKISDYPEYYYAILWDNGEVSCQVGKRFDNYVGSCISLNPLYIAWLNTHKNSLKSFYENKRWFLSNEHTDGATKYLRELDYHFKELEGKL